LRGFKFPNTRSFDLGNLNLSYIIFNDAIFNGPMGFRHSSLVGSSFINAEFTDGAEYQGWYGFFSPSNLSHADLRTDMEYCFLLDLSETNLTGCKLIPDTILNDPAKLFEFLNKRLDEETRVKESLRDHGKSKTLSRGREKLLEALFLDIAARATSKEVLQMAEEHPYFSTFRGLLQPLNVVNSLFKRISPTSTLITSRYHDRIQARLEVLFPEEKEKKEMGP
jgi:hypothetical protein